MDACTFVAIVAALKVETFLLPAMRERSGMPANGLYTGQTGHAPPVRAPSENPLFNFSSSCVISSSFSSIGM